MAIDGTWEVRRPRSNDGYETKVTVTADTAFAAWQAAGPRMGNPPFGGVVCTEIETNPGPKRPARGVGQRRTRHA